jgi:dolichyl-diphosphooligosaccharide--protein glycosyltransferase
MVDNNTWNNTHIATVSKVLSCSEQKSHQVMLDLDVDYVLVIFGGLVGYTGDDINKFLWIIRIGQNQYPESIKERAFFTEKGEYALDSRATKTMKNSLLYKLAYYRFADLFGGAPARDYARGVDIPPGITLSTVEEVYSTENLIVRLYKVKKPDDLGRPLKVASTFGKKRRRTRSQ